ncbi:hypothetical protein ACJJTC_014506 [Scirpophaga incertulas]
MDESCDIIDTAQLIIFVRYLDQTKETFVEEILALLPLLGKTRGEDINKAIMDFFDKDELDLKKLLSVTTDGAPAMVGSNKGLVHLLSSNASDQTSANAYLSFLKEKENVAAIAFLTDIFKHINDLNLKLQGKGKLVWELMSEVKSFTRKLYLFINDVGSERLHFPNLNKIISSDSEIDVGQYKTFITDLKSEFENRFADFKKIENVVEILSSIYSLHPDEPTITKKQNKTKYQNKKTIKNSRSAKTTKLRRISSSEDDREEEKDPPCMYCEEVYSVSIEGWISCSLCGKWAHNSCAGIDDDDDEVTHICEYCQCK